MLQCPTMKRMHNQEHKNINVAIPSEPITIVFCSLPTGIGAATNGIG